MRLLSLTFSFIFLFYTTAFANPAHGILMVVKGDVQVEQKGKLIPAKVGFKIVPGDIIITKKDARAKLVMIDKNVINISPDSKFVLEKYEYDPDQNKKGALLNVIYGKVRTTVNQKYDGDQHKFQVKTKSSVAGVRGTDFLVTFNQVTNTSKVVTFQGVVEVGQGLDIAGKIIKPVYVSPGQFTVASTGTPPAPPVTMQQSEMNTLKSETVAEAPTKSEQAPAPGDNKKERTPANKAPDGDKKGPPPGSVLNQMGEDASAPVVNNTKQPALAPLVPVGTMPSQMCPNGQCGAPTAIDPSLIQGKTNVLINLQPNP